MRTDIVLVKIGAAFIVVTAVGNFQYYLSLILGKPWWVPTAMIALLLVVIIPLLIAVVFWKFPNTVVGSLYTRDTGDEPHSVTADEVFLIGVTLLGLYTLVFGIVELAHNESLRYGYIRHLEMTSVIPEGLKPEVNATRIAGIIRVVIGIVLIAGRRRIVRLLKSVRTAGRPLN